MKSCKTSNYGPCSLRGHLLFSGGHVWMCALLWIVITFLLCLNLCTYVRNIQSYGACWNFDTNISNLKIIIRHHISGIIVLFLRAGVIIRQYGAKIEVHRLHVVTIRHDMSATECFVHWKKIDNQLLYFFN